LETVQSIGCEANKVPLSPLSSVAVFEGSGKIQVLEMSGATRRDRTGDLLITN